MSALIAPAPLPGDVSPEALLHGVFEVSLTGFILFRPVYTTAGGALTDFTYEYLNPAAQQMLQLPERPAESFLTRFPMAAPVGILAFYRDAFVSGQTQRQAFNFQHNGLDGYYQLVAQRRGPLLVVSFTDTNEQSRSAVEEALRQSQTLERTALAEAERQRALLYRVFEQAPAMICILQGPQHVFEFANPPYRALMGGRRLVGRPFAEAVPELVGQGILEPLNEVYRTGEPFYASEQLARLDHTNSNPSELEKRYYNLVWQARRDLASTIDGVLVFAYDVTPQVEARQQVQKLNEELATINEELRASNEEYQQVNKTLGETQQQLRQLNQELEARVQQRTKDLAVLNEELHDSNSQLTRTNVDLDTFIYTASHDLKAPIANLEGLLTALRHELPAEVQEQEITGQLLALMQGATERFRLTINQLTDVSRLQHAQDQPAERVVLAQVVAEVQLDLKPLLLSTQAEVMVDIAPDVTVLFAPKNLRSVVYNLLSNAVKYHHPDRVPVVHLRAVRQGPQVVLAVQDNGLGLNEHQQGRLFGLFQRLHTHVEGTGVGLYMVKRMVENAGGTITVQSELGQGCVFQVRFPLDPAQQKLPASYA